MIDEKTVERVAALARLKISEQEKSAFVKELGSIIEYIEQLKTAATEGVEPTAYMVVEHDSLRDDSEKSSLPAERVLKNGPSVKKGFFAVPKVIK